MPHPVFRSLLRAGLLALGVLAATAQAQFPSKPIRLVVPFPAGSATDVVGRILAPAVSAAIGQPVLVDNKAGADGAIAGTEVVNAAPDGHTLLLATNSPIAAVPALRKSPPYDAVTDFAPVTDVGRYTFFLFASAAAPFRTLAELIAHAKANPGRLNYATGNTTGILSFAQINALAGIDMTHVPYKGEPAGVTDLVANRVQLMIATPTTAGGHARDGRLKVIATTLPKRSPVFPDAPTMAESGMPQFAIVSWAALFAPGKTPREVVERLNREFGAAMKRPEVVAAMDKQAFFLTPSTPEQLGQFVREQKDAYARIVRAAGIQPE
ncbi:MAG: tripartite tricarboxylate transporter substrate binding protein [Burkholderiales bacterium]|nr:tripartite tricarboxylate transporter substrate binding protein [Burkholderiales bacterium]